MAMLTSTKILLLSLVTFSSLSATAMIAEVPRAEFWYTCSRTLTSRTLPQKFILAEQFAFENQTKEPLFLVVKGKRELKIANSLVYRFQNGSWKKLSYPEYAEFPLEGDGVMRETGRMLDLKNLQIENSPLIKTNSEQIEAFRGLAAKRGPGRLDRLPPPINYQLLINYKGKKHIVEASHICSLNEKYSIK